MNLLAKEVGQLGLVDVHVAAQEDHDVLVGHVLLIDDGLAGVGGIAAEVLGDLLDGLAGGGQHELERTLGAGDLAVVDDVLGGFHVGAVVALPADDDGILADGGEQHELVGQAAAHHAGVGRHGDDLGDAGAGEDPLVGLVGAVVVLLEVLLGGMEGVGILHGEFADADEAGAGAGFVAEFGLDLVDHEGVARVGLGAVADQLHGGLLMGHAEHHRGVVAVGEAQQLVADGGVTAGLVPERAGQHDGEEDLLAVDAVHLLAHDLLDLRGDALGNGEQRIDAVADVLDVAAADHEDVAGDLAIGGSILKSLGEHCGKFHNFTPFVCITVKL